jgi:hypothetical protein
MSAVLVTLEIEDLLKPITLPLPAAVDRLWNELSLLPLGENQSRAYGRFLDAGAEHRVQAAFAEVGLLHLSFALDGRVRYVRITPATAVVQ